MAKSKKKKNPDKKPFNLGDTLHSLTKPLTKPSSKKKKTG